MANSTVKRTGLAVAVALAGAVAMGPWSAAAEQTGATVPFKKIDLDEEFHAEGATFGDLSGNGHNDIIAGPYWWEGPDFETRREFYRPRPGGFSIERYSDNFFAYVYDFNEDGRLDILVIGFPGQQATLYLNPGSDGWDEHWPAHVVFDRVDNESPTFTDLTGDGRPEIVAQTGNRIGYMKPDWSDPTKPWTFHPISPEGSAGGHFTHGFGVGDITGNGRKDILEKRGWWEHPESLEGDPMWKFHEYEFARVGGAQMLVYDVNGDGLNDVVSSLHAHQFGLAWFEQVRDAEGNITFRRHMIMSGDPEEFDHGFAVSELHALEMADMNGNGIPDVVTGKRFWSHSNREPGATDPAYILWFETQRLDGGEVRFVPHVIDDDSGVGTQVVVGDINGNGLMDVVTANKKGTRVLLNPGTSAGEGE